MTLLWIRRDLRCFDNPALMHAVKQGCRHAVYISTPVTWEKHHQSSIKLDLIRRHLIAMANELSQYGIALFHLRGSDFAAQTDQLQLFCKDKQLTQVFANSEPEIDERVRDQSLLNSSLNITFFDSDVIADRGRVLNQSGEMFKVFTPFKNAWLKHVRLTGAKALGRPPGDGVPLEQQAWAETINLSVIEKLNHNGFTAAGSPETSSMKWPMADQVMQEVVVEFLNQKVCSYAQKRDIPSIKGTSGLSPYLAIGAMSGRTLYSQLIQAYPQLCNDTAHPAFSWLNELIWRDFYKHLLFHFPSLSKGQCFQRRYEHTRWPGSEEHFQAWSTAKTGYPIIDAAMRQLLSTGWMHNRLRMLVASFLTKHLLIDWRRGEQFFMEHLIDGDLSANNGGWQWAASTGCDAQPYFRVFNPLLQSKKFDPDGNFIRKYLPELADIPSKFIHLPHEYLAEQGRAGNYWPALVEHKAARLKAISFYKAQ